MFTLFLHDIGPHLHPHHSEVPVTLSFFTLIAVIVAIGAFLRK